MVLLCIGAILINRIRIEYVPSKDFTLWFFAFYIYVLVSFYISKGVISYYEVNGFINSLILLALIALLFNSEEKIELFYKTVVFCSVGLVFMGYAQILQEGMPRNGMTGFYSNHVVYALHIAWGLPISLYFYFKNKSKFYLLLSLVLLSGVLLAFSRGVLLALACSGFAGILFLRWFSIEKKQRVKYVGLAFLLFAVLGAGTMYFATEISPYFDPHEVRQFTSGRSILYEAAWDIFKESPIFGAGWEEFMDIWPRYADISRPRYGTFMGDKRLDVHSSYLKVLAELGVVGSIIFFMFNFSLWRSTWKASLSFIGTPMLFVLLIYYFHGFVDNNSFGNDRMFYFAAGLLFSIQRNLISSPPLPTRIHQEGKDSANQIG